MTGGVALSARNNRRKIAMRKTELLIPAGSLEVLKTAVIYGADAVYLGGEALSLIHIWAKFITHSFFRQYRRIRWMLARF